MAAQHNCKDERTAQWKTVSINYRSAFHNYYMIDWFKGKNCAKGEWMKGYEEVIGASEECQGEVAFLAGFSTEFH